MSRAEEITSEVRRLVLTCRSLEAQLQQSVPKKTYDAAVEKMQAAIDGLNAEVQRTKAELQNTTSIGERLSTLSSLVASMGEMVDSHSKQVSTQTQAMESQGKSIEALAGKVSQENVPVSLYNQTLSKVVELEEKTRFMVDRSEYAFLQKKFDDLSVQLSSMVPQSQYDEATSKLANSVPIEKFAEVETALANSVPKDRFVELETALSNSVPKQQYAELETALSNSVPREKFAELEAMVSNSIPKEKFSEIETALSVSTAKSAELEAALSNSVPKEVSTALESKITEFEMRLANSVPAQKYSELEETISGMVPLQQLVESQAKVADLEAKLLETVPKRDYEELTSRIASLTREAASLLSMHFPSFYTPQTEVHNEPLSVAPTPQVAPATASVEQTVPVVETPSPSPVVEQTTTSAADTEISEVQSNLSEIKGANDSGQATISPEPPAAVDGNQGFVFSSTGLCARSGVEFLQDLEQTPIEAIESHNRNGDFERWFKDVLSDEVCAASLQRIREGNYTGEDLRTKLVTVIAPRYRN
jgi:hypothetical protein